MNFPNVLPLYSRLNPKEETKDKDLQETTSKLSTQQSSPKSEEESKIHQSQNKPDKFRFEPSNNQHKT